MMNQPCRLKWISTKQNLQLENLITLGDFMTRIRIWLAALAATATLVALPAYGQQLQLRLGSPWPGSSPFHQAIVKFAEEVEKGSKGQVKVLIYPDGQLGDIQALINGMQTGTVDMSYLAIGNANVLKGGAQLNLAYVPYLFKSKAAAEEIANGPIFQKMYEDVASQSAVRIFAVYGQRTPRGVNNAKRAIIKPEDMKGLKIRIPPIDGMRQFVGALGGQSVVLGLGDTYQGISRGQVDGHENGIDAVLSFKWYEVAKFYTETGHMYETAAWYMQEKLWQSLTPELRKVLVDAAKSGGGVLTQMGEKMQKDGVDILKANGVIISNPDRAAFENVLKDAYKQSEGKIWPNGLVEQIRALPNNK
jgi:tripartite ATP-independent transporter DctP family solute receptor